MDTLTMGTTSPPGVNTSLSPVAGSGLHMSTGGALSSNNMPHCYRRPSQKAPQTWRRAAHDLHLKRTGASAKSEVKTFFLISQRMVLDIL